jgi:hypothetical protein
MNPPQRKFSYWNKIRETFKVTSLLIRNFSNKGERELTRPIQGLRCLFSSSWFLVGFFGMIKSTLSRQNITSAPKTKPKKDSQFEINSFNNLHGRSWFGGFRPLISGEDVRHLHDSQSLQEQQILQLDSHPSAPLHIEPISDEFNRT